ncbi:MAG TPA: heavy metal translocating P-type ATPase metal-binding domain-containing protein [Flavobacteriaceae bacterium]|nr:heavy metal translocating P-type ATPase metal-binding domain-containing protein [Flavobacteriaceae bacterium]
MVNSTSHKTTCYHCGDPCDKDKITSDAKDFCCNGCKTVYEIFVGSDLTCYYDLQTAPGAIPKEIEGKYDYLDTFSIAEKLLEFNDESTQIVTFSIPHIHCSSCIWILENLNKLNNNIKSSQVDFPKKSVRISYNSKKLSLKELVLLLCSIGYEPYISLENYEGVKKNVDRSLIYKLTIAGFSFGNVMFLSFPEYFDFGDYWLEQYKPFFRWLMFAFALPVLFYSASGYFTSAYKGLKAGFLNIDVPLALGILVLFLRSFIEIAFDIGSGFFDSFTGLVFFILLGKFFQQKTYNFLSFERDYKSYFPVAVTRIHKNGKETAVSVNEIKKGDRLLIRNEELIPVDGILIKGNAKIDYSFVTGESNPVRKDSGDKIYAGGKQISGAIEMESLKNVSQSYLTQLWSNDAFNKNKEHAFIGLTNSISKYFTITILMIVFAALFYWMFIDFSIAVQAFTAVLIIACPCALAMSAPFTLGNMLRIFGKRKFFLKNANAIEKMAQIDTIIFDKTGTITTNQESDVHYYGEELSDEEIRLLKSTLRTSNHPLSRSLYDMLKAHDIMTLDEYEEHLGKGLKAKADGHSIQIGSAAFVSPEEKYKNSISETAVHISTNEHYKGKYIFKNAYRKNVREVFSKLGKNYHLAILSGDNEGEKFYLSEILPPNTEMAFNQKPKDKLQHISKLQNYGHKVAMIGDGLNDAGALRQSDVGIAVSENVNVFSPACDAIIDATRFSELPAYFTATKKAMNIIKASMLLSLLYNVVGLYFAVTGQLAPVVAAIIMPMSSISVVAFTTFFTNVIGRKLR